MRPSVVISLALLVFSQVSLGLSEETAAETSKNEAATKTEETSLSRAKRGGYDFLRLGRGLHMLRLGKRNGASSQEELDSLDELLNDLQGYYEQYPQDPYSLEGDEVYPYGDDVEIPAHPRFRRSTPSTDGVVPPEVLQKASSEGNEPLVPEFNDVGVDTIYPEEDGYWYGDFDDFLEPQEGGEDDESFGLDKRQLPMLRMGKRSLGMLRLGKREAEDEEKRQLGMLRLGKRPMSMLRLGKRPMSMLRLGKRQDENLDEVYSEEEKRNLGMLRLGKRPMSMLRLGKRPMSMLRLGKRPMSMLRLGKRPMSMLRLGKRPMEKRNLGMLRLGKRPMSMLRLGKRPMSMLRLGKRPMSMLRLGKRDPEDQDDKRSLGMLRLGKRSTE